MKYLTNVYERKSGYYVKVKYYKGIVGQDEEMIDTKIVPGCIENCPLYKFKSVLKDISPSDEEIQCDKRVIGKARNQYKVAGNIITQIEQELDRYYKTRNILH